MSSKPNILIIMSDEQRTDTLGCYGNNVISTPNVDALAKSGTKFTNCFTPYPLCCPARTSLWTSVYPHRNHVIGNWLAINPELSDGGFVQHFREAGYDTMYTGKWHVPGTTPERLGFMRWSSIPVVLKGCDRGRYIEEYREYVRELGYEIKEGHIENLTENDLTKWIKNPKIHCGTADIKIEHYLETWQTEKLLDQMNECSDYKPFFAVCSYNSPHFPMIVPEPYDKKVAPDQVELSPNFCIGIDGKPQEVLNSKYYQDTKDLNESEWRKLIAHYWGFCSLVDDQVGKIIDWLKQNNKFDNTIIIYTSDHGDMIGSHGLNQKSWQMHYDETIRVPFIISGLGIHQGEIVEDFISLMDILPTLSEMCGVEGCTGIDGISFADIFNTGSNFSKRQYVLTETFQNCHSGNGQHTDPESIMATEFRGMNLSIRTAKEKYIFHWDDIDEYYDLVSDPYENVNIANNPELSDKINLLRRIMATEIEKNSPRLMEMLLKKFQEKG